MIKKSALILAFCTAVTSLTINAFASSTVSVNKVTTVRDEAELTDTYMKIIPHDAISTGDSIVLKFENAEVLTKLPEFGTLQGMGSSWDSLQAELYEYGAKETLLNLWSKTSDNYLPWSYRRLGKREIEVKLFPIPSELCDSNSYGRGTKPNYYLPLCVKADTGGKDAVDITVSIDANGTAIGGGSSAYDFASTPSTKTKTTVDGRKNTTEETTETTTEAVTEAEEAPKPESYEIRVTIGSVKATSDGKEYTLDVAPYIQPSSSSTMVPLRFVSVAAGGENAVDADNSNIVKWDAVTKTAVISLDGKKAISFTAGSNKININGKETVMENGVCAEIKDGRMFIPFRALGGAIGADVEWESSTKTAVFIIEK